MNNKIKLVIAALSLALGFTSATVVEGVGVAHASLFNCSATRSGITERSICEGVTAGGSQHQRAWIECFIPWLGGYRTYYGPTVGVFEFSTASAPSGASSCFGGYQLRS